MALALISSYFVLKCHLSDLFPENPIKIVYSVPTLPLSLPYFSGWCISSSIGYIVDSHVYCLSPLTRIYARQ